MEGDAMADQEHLAILKKGVEAWNEWRRTKPRIKPDLYSANLAGADLQGADLSEARLRQANLREADLTEADLSGAYLVQADLAGADLHSADLSGADLKRICLRGADLREACFRGASFGWGRPADLREANLRGADFTDAMLLVIQVDIEEISKARTLSGAMLETDLRAEIQRRYPRLLEEPEQRDAMAIRTDIQENVAVVSVSGSVAANDLPRLHDQITGCCKVGAGIWLRICPGFPMWAPQ